MYRTLWFSLITCNAASSAIAEAINTSYLAPYTPAHRDNVNPDVYSVSYRANHSLDAHYDHVGMDLSEVAQFFRHHENLGSYTIKCDAALIHDSIRTDPGVEWVVQDSMVKMGDRLRTEGGGADSSGGSLFSESTEPLHEKRPRDLIRRWGAYPSSLARFQSIWMAQLTTTHRITPRMSPFQGLEKAGLGINLYVLDTGINEAHTDFRSADSGGGQRVSNFRAETTTHYTTPQGLDPNMNRNADVSLRCHGTAMASLAAGTDYGLAGGANIINLRTCNDAGVSAISDLAAAINDIVNDDNYNYNNPISGYRGSVILIALTSVDNANSMGLWYQAIAAAQAQNIHVIVSAGNSGWNVSTGDGSGPIVPCIFSDLNPYGQPLGNVWCIGAMDEQYRQTPFSNWGAAVQAWTPGSNIVAATCDDNTSNYVDSGTSHSSAFAAGIMSTFASWAGPSSYIALNIVMAENGIDNALQADTSKTPVNPLVLTNGADSGIRYRGPFAWAPNGPLKFNNDIPDYWVK